MEQNLKVLDGVSGTIEASQQIGAQNTAAYRDTFQSSLNQTFGQGLLNCNPGLFWPQSTPTYGTSKAADMSIEFVQNGFILVCDNQKYVASNLNNLFKAMAKIIEDKLEKANEAKGKKK